MRLSKTRREEIINHQNVPRLTEAEKEKTRKARKKQSGIKLLVSPIILGTKPVNRKKNRSERRKRNVWNVPLTSNYKQSHSAKPQYRGL